MKEEDFSAPNGYRLFLEEIKAKEKSESYRQMMEYIISTNKIRDILDEFYSIGVRYEETIPPLKNYKSEIEEKIFIPDFKISYEDVGAILFIKSFDDTSNEIKIHKTDLEGYHSTLKNVMDAVFVIVTFISTPEFPSISLTDVVLKDSLEKEELIIDLTKAKPLKEVLSDFINKHSAIDWTTPSKLEEPERESKESILYTNLLQQFEEFLNEEYESMKRSKRHDIRRLAIEKITEKDQEILKDIFQLILTDKNNPGDLQAMIIKKICIPRE